MAKINIRKKAKRYEEELRQLEIILHQIEQLPIEERLKYADYTKSVKSEIHKIEVKHKELVRQKEIRDNIRFTWEVIKYVAGALLALVGLWTWVSLFAILG